MEHTTRTLVEQNWGWLIDLGGNELKCRITQPLLRRNPLIYHAPHAANRRKEFRSSNRINMWVVVWKCGIGRGRGCWEFGGGT